MKKKIEYSKNKGVIADGIALPFWIILLTYGIWKLLRGDTTSWIIIIIIGGALIIDSYLVIEFFKKNK